MSLPLNRDELIALWQKGNRFHFLFFYGHTPPKSGVNQSCFSQWFDRAFEVEGTSYLTAEHWMMAEKARLFGDSDMLNEILHAPTPKVAKACGRKVSHFDPKTWDEHKFEIVRRGNFEKFSQHPDLKEYLLSTVNYEPDANVAVNNEEEDFVREKSMVYKSAKTKTGVILVEAAGRDVVWGIGLGRSNPKAQDPQTWRGNNLLGFALTSVREEFARSLNI